jgi:hypothetical protein
VRRDAELVVDADGHVCEPPDCGRDASASLRERGIRLRWNDGDGLRRGRGSRTGASPTAGSSASGNAGTPFAELGRGRRYADGNPAGFEPRARLAVLDEEGIDAAVLYPGLALSLPAIHDSELAVASCRVYNDWIAEFCAADRRRLVGVAALPVQDPMAAVVEARRAVDELGLRGVFCRPNPLNGSLRQLHDDAYEPLWTTLEDLDVPLTFHPAGLWDMPGTSALDGRADGAGHAPRRHPLLRQLHDAREPRICGRARAAPGAARRRPQSAAAAGSRTGWIASTSSSRATGGSSPTSVSNRATTLRRQAWISFDPGEHTMGALTRFLPSSRMIWASDFPHSDAKYPAW